MRIGDKIELELNEPPVSQSKNLGKSIIGIITYLEPDKKYGEITINISDYTINEHDWFGFHYRIELTNTNELIYAKTESPHFDFKEQEFLINIVDQNIDNDFFCTRYSQSTYLKKLESGKLYNIVTTPNNIEFDAGTLFKIVSIDKESGILVCYNHTARNNQRLFPNKKPTFNEDIEVNVINGISKLNNNHILDFFEIDEDTDSDSDIDSDEELEETKDIYSIKGQLSPSEIELTEEQKREKIGIAISEMFKKSKLQDTDIINLIEHVFRSLYTKFDAMEKWKKNLELLNSQNIIPVIVPDKTNLKIDTDDQSEESDNEEEFDWKTANSEDYNRLDYYEFIEKQLQSLIIRHNSKQFNPKKSIECEQNGFPLVLNPSYIYQKDIIIPNTEDSALIKKYTVKNTNTTLEKLPPSVQMFSKIYDSIGNYAFSIFNTSINDIPNEYLRKIKLTKPYTRPSPLAAVQDLRWSKPSSKKLYIEKQNNIKAVSFNPVKIPDKLLNPKIPKPNKITYDTIKPFITDFIWDNNQIWPRSIVLSHFKNSKEVSEIINNFEGTSLIHSVDDDSYLEKINEKIVFKNSKERAVGFAPVADTPPGVAPPSLGLLPSSDIISETIEIWNSSKKITNRVLRSKTQLEILFGGKYVRNAEFKGENPYYFIDIFTGKEFIPKHIILQLEADISSKKNEQECLKCLANQWGEEEINTKNIVSIINGDIIGTKDDVHDVYNIPRVTIDVVKKDQFILSNHLGKDLELYSSLTSNGFVDCFIKIFNEFSCHKQYGENINLILSIDNYKEPLDEFFKTEADWNSYVSFFCFDELELYEGNSKNIEKIIKNLVRFSTNLKKTYIAWKKLKKDKTSSKDILNKLSKRLIKEIKNTRKNFEKKLYNSVGLYIASYIYSKIPISHEARIKIILNTFAFNSETNKSLWAKDNSLINESNIVTHARNKWNYSDNLQTVNKFTYSYKSNIGVFKKFKESKRSNVKISKKIKTIIPIVPKISHSKNATILDSMKSSVSSLNITHELGDQWELFKDDKLSIKKMEWAEINNDDNLSKHIIELHYKGLVKNIFSILLKETPNDKFTFPKIWKVLSDKGHLEKVRGWLSNIYKVSYHINTIENFNEFLEVVRDDIIDYRKYVSTNSIVSWRKTWLHLVQHLLHEMDTLDLAFSDYRIVLESVVTYLIENEEEISGRNIIMTKSIVEDAHAIAEEEEAEGFFGQHTDKDSQKLNREDSKRSLGRFKEGLRTQFDIKTVLASNDSTNDSANYSASASADPHQIFPSFDTDYAQNFDDGDYDD